MSAAGERRPAITRPEYRLGMKPANAGLQLPPELVTLDEMRRLLRATGRGYAGARNRAMWVVMWRCGLRISEALDLYPRDVNLDLGTVTVQHGKAAGGVKGRRGRPRQRVVGIDPEAAAVVAVWVKRRQELGVNGHHPLFCRIQRPDVGKPMHSSVAREALQEAAKRAGIEHRVHPHGLRHTHAMELHREKVSITLIQKQLGHHHLSSTARYLDHHAPLELIEAIQARTWGLTPHPVAS